MQLRTESTYIGIIPRDNGMCYVSIGGLKWKLLDDIKSRSSAEEFKKLRLWKAPARNYVFTSHALYPLKNWGDLVTKNLVSVVRSTDKSKSKVQAIEIFKDNFYG
tara:strand:- start:445 stop:759 length:315 start_codon:yes stop_codon:yes gene_type:complete